MNDARWQELERRWQLQLLPNGFREGAQYTPRCWVDLLLVGAHVVVQPEHEREWASVRARLEAAGHVIRDVTGLRSWAHYVIDTPAQRQFPWFG